MAGMAGCSNVRCGVGFLRVRVRCSARSGDGQTETAAPRQPNFLHSSQQSVPRWRNDRQDGVHDLPRVHGKDMVAAIVTLMTYTCTQSNRVSKNSSEGQNAHDAMPKSANE